MYILLCVTLSCQPVLWNQYQYSNHTINTITSTNTLLYSKLCLTEIMFRYHVTVGLDKKVLAVDDKSTLTAVIRQEFSVDESVPLLVQSWDAEFEDFVNVADVTQLPDKCKLQVAIKGEHSQFLTISVNIVVYCDCSHLLCVMCRCDWHRYHKVLSADVCLSVFAATETLFYLHSSAKVNVKNI